MAANESMCAAKKNFFSPTDFQSRRRTEIYREMLDIRRNTIAHNPIHMSMEQIGMKRFSKCIRSVGFSCDPSHAHNIPFDPFLNLEVFDVHVARSFGWLFDISHKKRTLIINEKSCGKVLRN